MVRATWFQIPFFPVFIELIYFYPATDYFAGISDGSVDIIKFNNTSFTFPIT